MKKSKKVAKEKIDPKLLKSAVFGANDGIITTFAVVAGVAGAGLPARVILILGLANIVADGISMALGDYIGERSEHRFRNGYRSKILRNMWHTGVVTFFAFLLAGALPLVPYILRSVGLPIPSGHEFALSVFATAFALFMVGSLRTILIKGSWLKNGLEMLAVGSIAAGTAYAISAVVERWV